MALRGSALHTHTHTPTPLPPLNSTTKKRRHVTRYILTKSILSPFLVPFKPHLVQERHLKAVLAVSMDLQSILVFFQSFSQTRKQQ